MWHIFKTRRFFSAAEKEQMIAAIQTAEQSSSGEIRVHVESVSGGDPITRAQQVFNGLGMNHTQFQNGVLIYLAIRERKFAIIGDQGIHQVVPENFWDDVKEAMQQLFQQGQFAKGVCLGIQMAGEHLAKHFPRVAGDINELSDEISEGK